MVDGEETWELAVVVPPVTEDVLRVGVRCGSTTVVVEPHARGDGRWIGLHLSGPVTAVHPTLGAAVDEARQWVEHQERKRLVRNAAEAAVDHEARTLAAVETCQECESSGYNCPAHSGPEWQADSGVGGGARA